MMAEDISSYCDLIAGAKPLTILPEQLAALLYNQVHLSEDHSSTSSDKHGQLLRLMTTLRALFEHYDLYRETCDRLVDGKLLGKLANRLTDDNTIVSYSAYKATAAILRNVKAQVVEMSWFDQLISRILERGTSNRIGTCHALDLFRSVFSSSDHSGHSEHFIGIREMCISVLEDRWPLMIRHFLPNSTSTSSRKWLLCDLESVTHSFLSLWAKLLMHVQRVKDQKTSTASITKSTSDLLELVLEHAIPADCYCKAVDVVTHCLPTPNELCTKVAGRRSDIHADIAASILKQDVKRWLRDIVPKTCVNSSQFASACFYTCEPSCDGDMSTAECNERSSRGWKIDDRAMAKTILLILKASATMVLDLDKGHSDASEVSTLIAGVLTQVYTESRRQDVDEPSADWLIRIFTDHDAMLLTSMLCVLLIAVNTRDNTRISQHFDPHAVFLSLVAHTSWDHLLLLDYISSPETCCLLYLLKYLKHLAQPTSWRHFLCACASFRTVLRNAGKPERTKQTTAEENGYNLTAKLTFHPVDLNCVQTRKEDESIDIRSKGVCALLTNQACMKREPIASIGNPVRELVEYSNSDDSDDDQVASTASGFSCESERLREPKQTPLSGCRELVLSVTDTLDNVMAVLIRLRLALVRLHARGVFPYNPMALVRLIEACEHLYEN